MRRSIPHLYNLLFCCLFSIQLSGQGEFKELTLQLEWNPLKTSSFQNQQFKHWDIEGGYIDADSDMPCKTFSLPTEQIGQVEIIDITTKGSTLNAEEQALANGLTIPHSPILGQTQTANNKNTLRIQVFGLEKNENGLQKITQVNFKYRITPQVATQAQSTAYKIASGVSPYNTNMLSGRWHQFAITKTGASKISYEQLLEHSVIFGPTNLQQFTLYGQSGKQLPYRLGEHHQGNLDKIAFTSIGGDDGSLDPGDYLLFYGEHAHVSDFDNSSNRILRTNNHYADTNYVFLQLNGSTPLIITDYISPSNSVAEISKTEILHHHEQDLLNFIKSGRTWVGEDFQNDNPLVFNIKSNHDTSEQAWIKVRACSRSFSSTQNNISIIIDEDTIQTLNYGPVSSVYHNDYVKWDEEEALFKIKNKDFTLKLYYHQKDESSLAWLDYFSLNFVEDINVNDSALTLITKQSLLNPDNYSYKITSNNTPFVWDISDYNKVQNIPVSFDQGKYKVIFNSNEVQKVLCFQEQDIVEAEYNGAINGQDLSKIKTPEYLIIYHPKFAQQAKELADFHHQNNGVKIETVNCKQIYNQFSGGRTEAGAIRNFIHYHYKNPSNDTLKYVLLFGSGSYDQKYRITDNSSYIPTYQSLNSIKLTSSYVTDDFYGVMDDGEGDFVSGDLLDLNIGRIPCREIEEAQAAVRKIKQYYNKFETQQSNGEDYSVYKDWRNKILFIADDGDLNEHMKQAEKLSEMVDTSLQHLNIKKIFIDNYVKQYSSAGATYPDAKAEIKRSINEGALIVNYTGHGGEYGWASERILDVNSIQKLDNKSKLPLVMTATCEFSRFDDPARKSAGEQLFFREEAGAIALFTTVRLVFSIPNFTLNKKLYDVLREMKNEDEVRLGDVFRAIKIKNNAGTNDRNFTLLGDPYLKLAIPRDRVIIDSISSKAISTDTIKALEEFSIHGHMENTQQSKLFKDGLVDVKIFDKQVTQKTLNNDNSPYDFSFLDQSKLLFKGTASVKKGSFSLKAILPKGTAQDYGEGKISCYFRDDSTDATGFNTKLIIGGTSEEPNTDNEGPEIKLYLNDSNFTFGDAVLPQPYLIAQLSDSSGINVSSNSINDYISVVLNNNESQHHNLNQHYNTNVDSYQAGQVVFELSDITEGKHSLTLSASDNYNNRNSSYTEFIIHENAALALEKVVNYPNPFTTNTGFYIQQNQLNTNLNVQIQIFTISGRLIKTIQLLMDSNQKIIGPINWDGLDDFGDPIGRGVYLYKVKASSEDGTADELIEKLVILK